MIEERLLLAEARRRRIKASDTDIQRAFAILRRSGVSQRQLIARLKAQGKSIEQYRARLAERLAIGRLLALEQSQNAITDATLRARYRSQRPNGMLFRHARNRLRHELTRERLIRRLRQRARITVHIRPLTGPRPALSRRLLDLPPLVSVQDIYRLLGSTGPFQIGRLKTSSPPSATYDTLHFKATGKSQSRDLAYRVWKLQGPALNRHFNALRKKLPKVRLVNRVEDRSARTFDGQVRGHLFLDRKAGVVALLTCGTQLCPTEAKIMRVAKLLHKRLHAHMMTAPAP